MKDETSIYDEYFEFTRKYTEIYGPKTVICMQVGSFYEIYGLKYPNSEEIVGSLITQISDITGLSVVSKKYTYKNATVYMSGFRDLYHTFDKYLQIMMENGYIVVEIAQDTDSPEDNLLASIKNKKKTRSLKAVHSAGTYLSYETDIRPNLTNHMMSIWMEQNAKKKRLIYGVSVLNIYTGESAIFEHEMEDWMNPTMFDELERYMAIYCPSEVIFLHGFQEEKEEEEVQDRIKKILNYIKIPNNAIVHILSLRQEKDEKKREILSNCAKQKYIEYVLDKFFGEETFQICPEFAYYMYATQSLCYLLHFLEEHNHCFTRKLSLPIFQNTSKRVILANHTLKQLNILADGSREGSQKTSSILSLLNHCQTAMGKRRFQNQLLQPVFDEMWLNTEYAMTEFFLDSSNSFLVENFRKSLGKVKDLEKIGRQIIAKKIYPSSIFDLYQSLSILQQLEVCMAEFPDEVLSYLYQQESGTSSLTGFTDFTDLADTIQFLETNLRITACQNNVSMQENVIARGISLELDEYQTRFDFLHQQLISIRDYLSKFVSIKKKDEESVETVKIAESEKNGYVLTTTKTRGEQILQFLSNKEEHTISSSSIHFTRKDIKIQHVNKTVSEIHFPKLDAIIEEMDSLKSAIQEKTKYYFLQFLEKFERSENYDSLKKIIRFVSTLDVILCKTFIARKYRYCQPEIVSDAEKAFVDAREIRHALIEHIHQKEIYVTNDIQLGSRSFLTGRNERNEAEKNEKKDGIVLFGTNAVGKTSLIRAIGIAIIMAQAGMYVPCSKFQYKPYTAIFSRILSNDNLFKGLSTFAVEISELGVILKNADQNSLILGDELCSGTETDSALAIFMTTLEHLHTKQSSFMFATHFHEILEFEEIRKLDRIQVNHLAVYYDREKDCLVYDRKLKSGEGSRTYGLEVCKSLYLPTAFLERAYELRRQLSPEHDGILSHVSSRYNAKKIRGFCENCNKRIGEEIHHLMEQKEANPINGYFETEGTHWIHKNHPANLMTVCARCHDLLHYVKDSDKTIHSGNVSPITVPSVLEEPKKKRVRKKTTNGYAIV